MAKDAYELLAEINEEIVRLKEFETERKKLIAQIDGFLDEANKASEREGDAELMNKATMLTYRIAHVLDASNDDSDELNDVLAEVLNERTVEQGGLDESPETIATLERMLAKAKYSNEVAKTLQNSLRDILEDAKTLKKS
jgi:hypothetical protein